MICSCRRILLLPGLMLVALSGMASVAISATATISTNKASYVSGDTMTLSATIMAGPDAGILSDIYIAAITPAGSMLMLDSAFAWSVAVTPTVSGFPLVDVSAPNFYSIPNSNLPSGNYTFAIAVVRAGMNPLNQANWLAIATVIVPYVATIPPLGFNAPPQLKPAVKAMPYRYSFCGPSVTMASDLCGGPATPSANVFDGNPPYHFALDTGIGFPPFGITLSLNGMLTGTPSITGTRTFGVCAVDLSGNQICKTVKLTVIPATCTGSFSGSATDTFNSSPFCSFRHTLSGSGTMVMTSAVPFTATFTASGIDVVSVLPGNFPQCTGSTVPANFFGPLNASSDGVTVTASATGGGGAANYVGTIGLNGTSVTGTLTMNNPAFDAPVVGPLNLICQ